MIYNSGWTSVGQGTIHLQIAECWCGTWWTIKSLMWILVVLRFNMNTRVSLNFHKCVSEFVSVHVAVSIPQEPPTNFLWVLGHLCIVATAFFIYKGFSEKYKGKNAIGPFLLSFLQKRSNQLNSSFSQNTKKENSMSIANTIFSNCIAYC